MREVGVATIMVAFFTYLGCRCTCGAFFPVAAACLFVGLFLLGDRVCMKWNSPTPGDTLVAWTESSLASVEHRIWLLTERMLVVLAAFGSES